MDCLYGFACNPCSFACPHGAITKSSTSTVPHVDYDKCIGCMECVYQCPGLAIFGYDLRKELEKERVTCCEGNRLLLRY